MSISAMSVTEASGLTMVSQPEVLQHFGSNTKPVIKMRLFTS